jgi:hypothetical protein
MNSNWIKVFADSHRAVMVFALFNTLQSESTRRGSNHLPQSTRPIFSCHEETCGSGYCATVYINDHLNTPPFPVSIPWKGP